MERIRADENRLNNEQRTSEGEPPNGCLAHPVAVPPVHSLVARRTSPVTNRSVPSVLSAESAYLRLELGQTERPFSGDGDVPSRSGQRVKEIDKRPGGAIHTGNFGIA